MHFSLAVVRADGEATVARRFSCAQIRSGRLERRLVRRFERLFREELRPAAHGGHELRAALAESRDVWLDWFQPWSFSALCTIEVAGEPTWSLAFLPGYYPELEVATCQAIEESLAGWSGKQAKLGLRSIGERPLVASMAWGRQPANVDPNEVVRWLVCLAVAYFERAAECQAATRRSPQEAQQPPTQRHGNRPPPPD
jgi:hypothetical protein